ncbi:cupin-like domain-containing protein [Congregibacter brevis]|uniref:Cupin-like domain-containing protein n=1 Tax=Congregibacter brevis TaxID=3081201 RepID=A0ABZ0IDT9_9GAMM|nr:cupin-like domain-containing protein [Congregibacter sp. IMCC45268]
MAEALRQRLVPGGVDIPESSVADVDDLCEFLQTLSAPQVIRGLVGDWPIVQYGKQSRQNLGEYLLRCYSGAPLITSSGSAATKGRIAYDESFKGFNFHRSHMQLQEFLSGIESYADQDEPPTLYVGSSLLEHWFPGVAAENTLTPSLAKPLASLWLGNRVVVSAHFDFPNNLACCVAGRRRFTLFPPEQLENLYVGPWDMTPAGQPVSLVDLLEPDLERFPRFSKAMEVAQEVVLEPGDALFIPSMWWHHVEGLDDLNVLLNYWWRSTPAYMGTPMNVLKHAMLTVRSLPIEQRQVWRDIFDYYIFGAPDEAIAHIPDAGLGMHGPMDENRSRALRAELLNALNR